MFKSAHCIHLKSHCQPGKKGEIIWKAQSTWITHPRGMSRNDQLPPGGFPTKTCKASSRDNQPLRRHVSLRDMALTPDNVPPFTIPPLCALAAPLTSAPPGSAASLPERGLGRRLCLLPAELQLSDELHSVCTPSDPAMTLLHLAKVTTPYGFVTLAERPRVRRKESLFFDDQVAHKPRRSDSAGQLRL